MGLTYPGSIDSVKCTAVGTVVRFRSETLGEGEFIYLSGAASVDAGDVCSYEIAYNASVATSVVVPWAGAANIPCPLCVATAATVASTFGWYQVSGSAVVNSSGAVAEGDDLFWQAAGVVSATLAPGKQMMSAVAASANGVPATDQVIVTIDRPLAQGDSNGSTLGPFLLASRVAINDSQTTITATDVALLINKTVGSATAITLPTPTLGRVLIIKDMKGDSGTNAITLDAGAAKFINGLQTLVMNANYAATMVIGESATQWGTLI